MEFCDDGWPSGSEDQIWWFGKRLKLMEMVVFVDEVEDAFATTRSQVVGRSSCNNMPLTFRHVLDAVRLIWRTDCLSLQTEYITPSDVIDRQRLEQRQMCCSHGKEVTCVQIQRGRQRINAQKITHRHYVQPMRHISNILTDIHNGLSIYDLIGSWTMAAKRLLNQTRISQKCNVINWGYVPGNWLWSKKKKKKK